MINVWIWLIKSHFDHIDSKKFGLISLLTGLFSVWVLKLAHWIIDQINIISIRDSSWANYTIETLLFVIIVHSIISVVFVAVSNHGFWQLQIILALWGTILICTMSGISIIGMASTTIYYLFVALSEEYLKSCWAYMRFARYKVTSSDIIIFGLVAGLGFSCVENIIYLMSQITQLWTQHILMSSSLIITKGITSTMMHLFFTSFFAMAYLHYTQTATHHIRFIIIGILTGVCAHRSYDTILSYGYWMIVIVYGILWYFWLTYILYHSDRLYIDPQQLKSLNS